MPTEIRSTGHDSKERNYLLSIEYLKRIRLQCISLFAYKMPKRITDREERAASDISVLYNTFARQYDNDRSKELMEEFYLREILRRLTGRNAILDLGCGSGEPIARFFLEAGCSVTGVDLAPAMLEICRARFPEASWIQCDMRFLALKRRFDAILAWDSFFHLPADDQKKMFALFQNHAAPHGLLLFTSGSRAGTAIGSMHGHELFHASLERVEYEWLLANHGFEILLYREEDPACGNHTVWLAQHRAS
jgi:SAM-dependent methyltransferase